MVISAFFLNPFSINGCGHSFSQQLIIFPSRFPLYNLIELIS